MTEGDTFRSQTLASSAMREMLANTDAVLDLYWRLKLVPGAARSVSL